MTTAAWIGVAIVLVVMLFVILYRLSSQIEPHDSQTTNDRHMKGDSD